MAYIFSPNNQHTICPENKTTLSVGRYQWYANKSKSSVEHEINGQPWSLLIAIPFMVLGITASNFRSINEILEVLKWWRHLSYSDLDHGTVHQATSFQTNIWNPSSVGMLTSSFRMDRHTDGRTWRPEAWHNDSTYRRRRRPNVIMYRSKISPVYG